MQQKLVVFLFFTCLKKEMALEASKLKVEHKPLYIPPLQDIANVLSTGLKANFARVNVEVVDSPDLTEKPFALASEGLCGKARITEVGGPGYLLPSVMRDKIYNVTDLAKLSEVENAFVIGAGAGPFPFIGVNSEEIVNLKVNHNCVNQQTRSYKVNVDDGGSPFETILPSNETRIALLGNLFISEGKSGKVLKVHVKKRIGDNDFIASIRTALANHYGDKVVGMGGTFLIKSGKVHQHIMPDFSKTPLNSEEDLNNWLKFYNMSAPLVAVGAFVTRDYDLDLRLQHFHTFSHHGEGGHYHYDVTPDIVEYLGYFNTGEFVYRIDQPPFHHDFGRD